MSELVFHVNLVTTRDGIESVLWLDDGLNAGLSTFGERAKEIAEEAVSNSIDTDEWESFFDTNVSSDEVVYLGTVVIDDTKTIVDDGYVTKPSEAAEVRSSPINF